MSVRESSPVRIHSADHRFGCRQEAASRHVYRHVCRPATLPGPLSCAPTPKPSLLVPEYRRHRAFFDTIEAEFFATVEYGQVEKLTRYWRPARTGRRDESRRG